MEQLTCTRCGSVKSKHMFFVKNRHRGTASGVCKQCISARERAYKKSLPAEVLKNKSRKSYLRIMYGLTFEDYAKKLGLQGGGCAICGSCENFRGDQKMLHVDHDHATGKVRGILCAKCNGGLGYFKDSPELLSRAIAYLNSWSSSD